MRCISVRCGVEYFELPKCACTSIKTALLVADGRPADYPHALAHWRRPPADWRPRLTFTFVRDPLARVISSWREKLQTGKARILDPRCTLPPAASLLAWCQWISATDRTDRPNKHWAPQSSLLPAEPHFVGRVESIDRDWQTLREAYDLPELPRRNVTPPADVAHQITPEVRRLVRAIYRADYERFAYDADPLPAADL